jgi:SAM-dependent methyltransferase
MNKGRNAYDILAREYYTPFHKTSRNFDLASATFLRDWRTTLTDELIVELGAGRGRANEFLGVSPMLLIQLDSSESMLEIEPREECLIRILSDARSTPFLPSTFGTALAFLFDPFNEPMFYNEVFRILKVGGYFIGTLPSYEWGVPLRDSLGIARETTRFYTQQGELVSAASFLTTIEEIERRLREAGFVEIEIAEAMLPAEAIEVSPDIEAAAKEVSVSVFDLPLVQVFRARK